jgi:hypothetical protein
VSLSAERSVSSPGGGDTSAAAATNVSIGDGDDLGAGSQAGSSYQAANAIFLLYYQNFHQGRLRPGTALAGAADSVAESAGSGSTYSGHIAFTVDRAFQRINDEARKKFLALKCDA